MFSMMGAEDSGEPRPNVLIRRHQQLLRWNESDTNTESGSIRDSSTVNFPQPIQFLAACSNSDMEEIKRLLKDGIDINVANVDGLTALHQACIDNDLELVEFLVRHDANVNVQDNEGWTPLHATASCGYLEVAKFLIEHGANLDVVSYDIELPIDVAQGDDMTQFLSDEMDRLHVDGNQARNFEEMAMLEDVNSWIESGVYRPIIHPRTGASPLHVAASKEYTQVIELILKIPEVDVNAVDMDGWTPLHAAAHWNKKSACELLVRANADLDVTTCANQTIFDVADEELVPFLRAMKEEQRLQRQSNATEPSTPPKIDASKRRSSVVRMTMEEKQSVIQKNADDERKELEKRLFINAKMLEEEDRGREKDKLIVDVIKEEEDDRHLKDHKEEANGKVDTVLPNDIRIQNDVTPDSKMTEKNHEDTAKINDTIAAVTTPTTPLPKEPSPEPNVKPEEPPPHPPPVANNKKVDDLISEELEDQVPQMRQVTRRSRIMLEDWQTRREAVYMRVSAVMAPTKGEETEAQRSVRARHNRTTRRSTQGVTQEELEEAKKLMGIDPAVPAVAPPTSTDMRAPTLPTSEPSRNRMAADVDRSQMEVTNPALTRAPATTTLTATVVEDRNEQKPRSDSPGSDLEHPRHRRRTRDRVPTGKVATDDVQRAQDQVDRAPPVPATPPPDLPPSSTVVTLNRDGIDSTANRTERPRNYRLPRDSEPTPSTTLSNSSQPNQTTTSTASLSLRSRPNSYHPPTETITPTVTRYASLRNTTPSVVLDSLPEPVTSVPPVTTATSKARVTLSTPSPQSMTPTSNATDWKRLYEEERAEKDRLKRKSDQLRRELTDNKNELERLRRTSTNTSYDSRRLEKKLSEYEQQVKEIEKLKAENMKMKEENGALIRVISKLSK